MKSPLPSFVLATALLLAGFAALPRRAAAAPPPNIVFILCDDLGINDLHCYGRADHRTPHLDRLATQGMRFTSAYAAQPICSPSRAAILTGKAPARLHLTTFLPGRPNRTSQQVLHPEIEMQVGLGEKMLSRHFKSAGYVTAAIGKWHVGGNGFGPLDQGFDFAHAGSARTTPSATEGSKGEFDLTAAAERFIEANRTRPFLVYLAHNAPHIPYAARPDQVAQHHEWSRRILGHLEMSFALAQHHPPHRPGEFDRNRRIAFQLHYRTVGEHPLLRRQHLGPTRAPALAHRDRRGSRRPPTE